MGGVTNIIFCYNTHLVLNWTPPPTSEVCVSRAEAKSLSSSSTEGYGDVLEQTSHILICLKPGSVFESNTSAQTVLNPTHGF